MLRWALSVCLATVAVTACPGADDFIKHAIQPARPGADGNTVPSMVWLDDVDGDGRVDLITGGVDKKDNTQQFRWYEFQKVDGRVRWIEHVFGVTSVAGFRPGHGFYCGEMTWGDMDGDGDLDFVYAGHGGGFLGWCGNRRKSTTQTDQ